MTLEIFLLLFILLQHVFQLIYDLCSNSEQLEGKN